MTAIGKPWGGLARIGMASRDIGPGNCLIDHWMRKYHHKYIYPDEKGFSNPYRKHEKKYPKATVGLTTIIVRKFSTGIVLINLHLVSTERV